MFYINVFLTGLTVLPVSLSGKRQNSSCVLESNSGNHVKKERERHWERRWVKGVSTLARWKSKRVSTKAATRGNEWGPAQHTAGGVMRGEERGRRKCCCRIEGGRRETGRETGSDPKALLIAHPERTQSLGTAAQLPVRSWDRSLSSDGLSLHHVLSSG